MDKLTVLVVDDDKEIVDSIAIFLQADGYAVEKAYNGLEALDVVMTRPVHLLLLDIMMPEMDGIKTLLKVRESSRVRTQRLAISLWQVSENSPPNRTYTSRCIRLSSCQSNFPACNLS